MAEKPDEKKADEKTNPGTPSPEATESSDTSLAKNAGISEGDVHALRDDAGLNQLPGHESDIHAWSQSPAGKAYAEGEKDREKQYKAEEKAYKEQFSKDGLTEAEAKYKEAVEKG